MCKLFPTLLKVQVVKHFLGPPDVWPATQGNS